MSGSVVYLLVIISHGASQLKLDDCVPMPRPQADGRVVWWHEVAAEYGFKCDGDKCTRGEYVGFAKVYGDFASCKEVVKAKL